MRPGCVVCESQHRPAGAEWAGGVTWPYETVPGTGLDWTYRYKSIQILLYRKPRLKQCSKIYRQAETIRNLFQVYTVKPVKLVPKTDAKNRSSTVRSRESNERTAKWTMMIMCQYFVHYSYSFMQDEHVALLYWGCAAIDGVISRRFMSHCNCGSSIM